MKKNLAIFLCLLLMFSMSTFAQDAAPPAQPPLRAPVIFALWPGITSVGNSTAYNTSFSLALLANQIGDLKGMSFALGFTEAHSMQGLMIAGVFNSTFAESQGIQVASGFNQAGISFKGVQAAMLFNSVEGSMSGIQTALLFNTTTLDVAGIQLAVISNTSSNLHGLQASYITNSAWNVSGFQGAGVFNSALELHGVQIAGVFNNAKSVSGAQLSTSANFADDLDGIQISGLFNVAGNYEGAQLGLFANKSKNFSGLQASTIINIAGDFRGIQAAGILNIAKEANGVQLGLVNISKSGIAMLGSYYELGTNLLVAEWQSGTRWLFPFFSVGCSINIFFNRRTTQPISPQDETIYNANVQTLSAGFGTSFGVSIFDFQARLSSTLYPDKSPPGEYYYHAFTLYSYPSITLLAGIKLPLNLQPFAGAKFDFDIPLWGAITPPRFNSSTAFIFGSGKSQVSIYPRGIFGIKYMFKP